MTSASRFSSMSPVTRRLSQESSHCDDYGNDQKLRASMCKVSLERGIDGDDDTVDTLRYRMTGCGMLSWLLLGGPIAVCAYKTITAVELAHMRPLLPLDTFLSADFQLSSCFAPQTLGALPGIA
ncbi:hypothetical protein IE81DRAFT_80407 [Ceraceosorus guamensis]|uniref:Uncharacterized protein n=1 Tax=Ceraceosorus guamensis TaxID=1522189 RepID=A0A316WAH5_9BASI|nr:hypothetical protein IE81DRAFT_80407 [Ceraceosorus guamensis]PWN46018.1 hypothetical protein IE81DRAFT_80407 [Ceraceosorus guamensis]